MNNKKFLLIAFIVIACVFVVIANLNKKQTEAPTAKLVSSEVLIKVHSPIKGEQNAPVTIVEFLDPECEACRAMHPIIKQLMNEYEGKVRLVIRYMPLHKNSMYAASVLEEAREQNKFEEALDILFENQPAWANHQAPRPDLIPTFLERLGISKESLKPEVVIPKHTAKIEIDKTDGFSIGANRTPTFFVNGLMLEEIGYTPIKVAIEEVLAAKD